MSRRTCARFARAAGVSEGRILADYEAGVMELRPVDLGAMQAVLEAAGVESPMAASQASGPRRNRQHK